MALQYTTSTVATLAVFLLTCCWVSARSIVYFESDNALRPIVSQSQKHRICVELCTSGLGGTPCGSDCVDLVPASVPVSADNGNQSVTADGKYNVSTRQDSCDVLCKNGLGFPLCNCQYEAKTYEADFVAVCSTFCESYDYQIYGCQSCDLLKNYFNNTPNEQNSASPFSVMSTDTMSITAKKTYWRLWCVDVCSTGDGGAACNCDLLP
ncbi:uncharacterized protein LOC132707991 isoform X1 [Cylas formicarius]|uniref:uncharacterized protein LOC132707991 isoform X1 n=1 Tax=Cylas formicarius TaxID=197179 RepID=UPI002958B79F|nr:uncharacterized protein LOC132707991 isoform X1 [Cylas formicarius]